MPGEDRPTATASPPREDTRSVRVTRILCAKTSPRISAEIARRTIPSLATRDCAGCGDRRPELGHGGESNGSAHQALPNRAHGRCATSPNNEVANSHSPSNPAQLVHLRSERKGTQGRSAVRTVAVRRRLCGDEVPDGLHDLGGLPRVRVVARTALCRDQRLSPPLSTSTQCDRLPG